MEMLNVKLSGLGRLQKARAKMKRRCGEGEKNKKEK